MKKIFEKYDLIKATGILVLLSVVLTWLIPYGYFSGTGMQVSEISRVGLTNFFQYGLLGMYYFTVLITFLFVLGGFYQVLSRVSGYQALVKGISKKLKGHEKLFVVIVSLFLAVLCSLTKEYFPLLVFIPFIISILNRLKVDKLAAFSATFGALLVGVIGSTYADKVINYLLNSNGAFGDSPMWARIVLFVCAYALLMLFTILRMRKNKSANEEYDKFEVDSYKSGKKARIWPYIVGLALIALTTILAYLPWDVWKVTVFTSITKWVNEASIAGVPIFSYVFGTFSEFGTWDIFTIQFVMLFATLLIHWFGKVSLDEVFESYGEGFKKMGYVVVVLLFVYAVLEFSVMFPVLPVMVDWVAKLTDGFNVALAFINGLLVSLFGVEMQYVMSLGGNYYAAMFAENASISAVAFQSAFGLVSFFAPSSAILMIGLAYLGIPYKEWLKYIWKFLVAMLLVIVIILTILTLM